MGKALYRQYRPKSLSEIIGQEHITQTLDHALRLGTISHAYLFTGPRGTGKTSTARILAHEVNKLPYSERAHLDIIEIDAASNRRIDEIRELKERVHTAPTSVKYKVYIIDEVHMLTKEAFNALLKTLEEPPEHAIFILATTEAHKVPETIISRAQRFTFKPVPADKEIEHLAKIAKQEKITIDRAALELITAHSGGSLRDSISLLDQVRHAADRITLEHIQRAIGQAPDALLSQLVDSLRTGSLVDTAQSLAALGAQGIQPPQVARQLSQLLRQDVLTANPLLPTDQALELLHSLVDVGGAADPSLKLELALYASVLGVRPLATTAKLPAVVESPAPHKAQSPYTIEPKKKMKPKHDNPPDEHHDNTVLDKQSWLLVLASLKSKHNTLYGVTRMAVPTFESGKVTLSLAFAFHQKRLNDNKNKQLLTQIIYELTGQNVSVECVLDPQAANEPPVVSPSVISEEAVDLEAISNIFGSAEVVE